MKGYSKTEHVDEHHGREDHCSECGVNPPLGTLKRCACCIKAEAERSRATREGATARVKSRKDAALVAKGNVKTCRCCKTTKPITAFQVWRSAKDGHRHDCRECVATGAKQPKKPRTEAQKAREREQAKAPHRRVANRRAVAEWARRNPDAVAAKRKLRNALKSGIIAKPMRCQVKGCSCTGPLEAHHFSYRHPLAVTWVCVTHHRLIHSGNDLPIVTGLPNILVTVPTTLEGASA